MFVKICGITNEEDGLLAVAMGADAIGFMFAPSTRQIAPTRARDIARRLPPETLTLGVFKDQAPEQVVEIVGRAGLGGAQLSGHERAEDARWIRERVPFLVQAFTAGSAALDHADEYGADALMIDGPKPGSGQVFDWSLAEGAPAGHRLILAGGLTPENVAGAIEVVRPWGVDVSTGVESAPGRKDPRKVRAFVQAARSVPDLEAPVEHPSGGGPAPYDWQDDL
jgi:phosphoribosylanthranilate isomerase